MPPTVRYGVDGPRRLPLALHVTRLHRTPFSTHGSFACLEYPCGRQVVMPAFHWVTPAYSPKRLVGMRRIELRLERSKRPVRP